MKLARDIRTLARGKNKRQRFLAHATGERNKLRTISSSPGLAAMFYLFPCLSTEGAGRGRCEIVSAVPERAKLSKITSFLLSASSPSLVLS